MYWYKLLSHFYTCIYPLSHCFLLSTLGFFYVAHVSNVYVRNNSTFLGKMLERKTSEESKETTAEISIQIDCRKLVDPAAILGLKPKTNGRDACLTYQRGTGQQALPASFCLCCYRARLAHPDNSLNLFSPGAALLIPPNCPSISNPTIWSLSLSLPFTLLTLFPCPLFVWSSSGSCSFWTLSASGYALQFIQNKTSLLPYLRAVSSHVLSFLFSFRQKMGLPDLTSKW